jgi:hypothetical protein
MEYFKAISLEGNPLCYTKEVSIEISVTTDLAVKVTKTVCCSLNKLCAEFKMPYLNNGKHRAGVYLILPEVLLWGSL